MAEGIVYIGNDYKTQQEVWIGNEDARQHVAVPGTTGAGKTEALLSLASNALTHARSGFIFVDGKADSKLYAKVMALARRFGREDDVLVLNFLVAVGANARTASNPFASGQCRRHSRASGRSDRSWQPQESAGLPAMRSSWRERLRFWGK